MIAKELNNTLNDDKLREQWLKRILPALVITVIYFVFISKTLLENHDKAQTAHQMMLSKGVTEMVLPSMHQQDSALDTTLIGLRQKDQELQASLAEKAGFLFGKNDMNAEVEKIAALMQKHHLKVSEEHTMTDKKVADLPKTAADLKHWLSDSLKTDETVRLHRILFMGTYPDAYAALRELALGDIKALPVFLQMKDPDKNPESYLGSKAWTLDLWI